MLDKIINTATQSGNRERQQMATSIASTKKKNEKRERKRERKKDLHPKINSTQLAPGKYFVILNSV